MIEAYWDLTLGEDAEEERDEGPTDAEPMLRVNGATYHLQIGDPFVKTVVGYAYEANFGKFDLRLNGEKIKPHQAPELIEKNHYVEIFPFDEAG